MNFLKRGIISYIDKRGYQLVSKTNEPYRVSSKLNEVNIKNLKVLRNREEMIENFPKKAIIAEIGVDEGNFSEKILEICQPATLYLIDLWGTERYNDEKKNAVEIKFQKQIAKKKVEIRRGYSTEVLADFEDGVFDWIYLDTLHDLDLTRKELEICRLKVKKDGIISGHDYCQGNISKSMHYGVVQAVHEFCVKYNWELIYITQEIDLFWSFAIQKIG